MTPFETERVQIGSRTSPHGKRSAVPSAGVGAVLPVGVQIIAAPWREDLLFAAALRLERAGVVAAHPPGALR